MSSVHPRSTSFLLPVKTDSNCVYKWSDNKLNFDVESQKFITITSTTLFNSICWVLSIYLCIFFRAIGFCIECSEAFTGSLFIVMCSGVCRVSFHLWWNCFIATVQSTKIWCYTIFANRMLVCGGGGATLIGCLKKAY